MRKTVLLLNGKAAARPDVRGAVQDVQRELGIDVWVPWDDVQLRDVIKQSVTADSTRIIAAGGDGTLNAVTNAVFDLGIEAEVSVGLVPLGTANDFARGYGDTGGDLKGSLRNSTLAEARPIDVGVVNGKYFVNVASGGFGAMITSTTPTDIKRKLGGLAYTLSGLARLSELRPANVRFGLDDQAPFMASVTALVIANSRFAGGGFNVAPEAQLSDGFLDLGILTAEILQASPLALAGGPETGGAASAFYSSARFQKAVLEMDQPFHLNLDGEPTVSDRFEIEVLPGRLNFAFPE